MIYNISPMELFLDTCYSCKNYKQAKKFIRTKTTFPKVHICFKCRLGEYSNFSPSGKFSTQISEKTMLKQPLEEFEEGNRVIYFSLSKLRGYAKLTMLLPGTEAIIKMEKTGKEEVVDLFDLIKVENDGLSDRQRLIKLYRGIFNYKWSKERWEKIKTYIDFIL